jgi:hypothetical protein
MLHVVTDKTFAYYSARIERAYRARMNRASQSESSEYWRIQALAVALTDEKVQATQFARNISLWMKRLDSESFEKEERANGAKSIDLRGDKRKAAKAVKKNGASFLLRTPQPQMRGRPRNYFVGSCVALSASPSSGKRPPPRRKPKR